MLAFTLVSILRSISEPVKTNSFLLALISIPDNIGKVDFPVTAF